MCTGTVPATWAQAQAMLDGVLGFLAAEDTASLPAKAVADRLRALERHDAVEAAVRGRLLVAFGAQDGPVADGQRSIRSWLIHTIRVTRAQAAEYQATQALARDHQALLAALDEGWALIKSEALQLAKWTKSIPGRYRGEAEELLVAAARAGVDLRGLAALCAEIRARTAEADPDGRDPGLDRGLSLAGEYRARWAAHRTAASVSPGDGGAWLEGDTARQEPLWSQNGAILGSERSHSGLAPTCHLYDLVFYAYRPVCYSCDLVFYAYRAVCYSCDLARYGYDRATSVSVPERAGTCGHERSPAGNPNDLRPGHAQVDPPCVKRPSKQPIGCACAVRR
jgi:hypothetical protein